MSATTAKAGRRTAASLRAEGRFRARVEELGGTVLEPTWLGTGKSHRIRCAEGHDCKPRPDHVFRGKGLCRTCAGKDPKVSEAAFLATTEGLGGTPLWTEWKGVHVGHLVRCAAGHEVSPRPAAVQQGQGLCRVCAGKDPATAEAKHRERVIALGGTPLWTEWKGNGVGHLVRCLAGHDVSPRPSGVQQGQGLCRACAGKDPDAAEAAHRERVIVLGGTPLWTEWKGVDTGHLVRCVAGHDTSPRPTSVQRGSGLCRFCAGKVWDAFYVVSGTDTLTGRPTVKLGVTSGDPRPRIGDHNRDGLTKVHGIWTGKVTARQLEVELLSKLRAAGHTPTRGREYFHIAALPAVLSLAGDWMDYGFTYGLSNF